jgi:hypothetical protein
MAKTNKKPAGLNESVEELEKLIRKVIRVAFKDNTLDYTIQVARTSLEPGVTKYGFMINGLKKEIQPIAMSYYTYAECKIAIEALLEGVNTVELEKSFHNGRINVYTNAISSHKERLEEIEKNGLEEDDGIEMEEV